jgi:hypothetical protein
MAQISSQQVGGPHWSIDSQEFEREWVIGFSV